MSDHPISGSARSQRVVRPGLLLIFAASGCAALIYEQIWFQMLEIVVGATATSLAVVLGTFMGGMGIGNLLLPKFIPTRYHPLRVYAVLELGIAVSALVVWYALPVVTSYRTAVAVNAQLSTVWNVLVPVIFLLPPTLCMGATLPIAARWTGMTRRGSSLLGGCYAINTVGAVAGAVISGFYLLRAHDGLTATVCAVALNVGVAAIAMLLARTTPDADPNLVQGKAQGSSGLPTTMMPHILGAIALSGFSSLAAQVIWTRLLSLTLGGTVYNFSLILSVFLAGLGGGSLLGSNLGKRSLDPIKLLGLCQALLVFAVVWGTDSLTQAIPFWPSTSVEHGFWIQCLSDLLRTSVAILPPTFLWGASFPLALSAVSGPAEDPAQPVARIYWANMVGAVLGATAAPLLLLPKFGTARAESLVILLSLLSALLLLRPRKRLGKMLTAGVAVFAILMVLKPSTVPWQVVAYGRHAAEGDQTARALYIGEGSQATVAVSQNVAGNRYFHVSGKTEASTHLYDMRLQRMLGALPALIHPNPRSILIVGLGAGVTAGSFVPFPSVKRIVICEIEPLIPQHVTGYFAEQNHHVLKDPRVELVIDDARHFLAHTQEKFDIITSDPIHPWVKGSAKLYSAEYFRLCSQHLLPGGIVTQWVPFYSSSDEVVRSEIATFFSVFPDTTLWGNEAGGKGYDSVLLGSPSPLQFDVEKLKTRLAQPTYSLVRQSLSDVDFPSAQNLLATYVASSSDLVGWLQGAEINRDRSLRLQYLAGVSVNSRAGIAAYREMLERRTIPDQLFQGNEADLQIIRNRETGIKGRVGILPQQEQKLPQIRENDGLPTI